MANKLMDTFKQTADMIAVLNRGHGIPTPDLQSTLEYLKGRIDATAPTLEVVSVKDYGAKGDGVADDTEAIQAALGLGNRTVFFPRGHYKVSSTISIPPNTSIIGSGRHDTIIDMQNLPFDVFVISKNSNDIYISNIQIRNVLAPDEPSEQEKTGIRLNGGRNVVIENCLFDNCDDSGIRVGYDLASYQEGNHHPSSNVTIRFNEVRNSNDGHGIEVIRTENVMVIGNVCHGNYRLGIRIVDSHNVLVSHNTTYNNGFAGIGLQTGNANKEVTGGVYGVNVTSNQIFNETRGISLGDLTKGGKFTVANNTISNCETGIAITNLLEDTNIINNTIESCYVGIEYRKKGQNVLISGNTIRYIKPRETNSYGILIAETSDGTVPDEIMNNVFITDNYIMSELEADSGSRIYPLHILNLDSGNVYIFDNIIQNKLGRGITINTSTVEGDVITKKGDIETNITIAS